MVVLKMIIMATEQPNLRSCCCIPWLIKAKLTAMVVALNLAARKQKYNPTN